MAEEQKEETVRQEVEDKSEGAIQEPGTDIPDQGPVSRLNRRPYAGF